MCDWRFGLLWEVEYHGLSLDTLKLRFAGWVSVCCPCFRWQLFDMCASWAVGRVVVASIMSGRSKWNYRGISLIRFAILGSRTIRCQVPGTKK